MLEGWTTVLVPKASFGEAVDLLKSHLGQLADKKDFVVSFAIDEYTLNHRNQPRVTVYCNKRLFDSYTEPVGRVGAWQEKKIECRAYWKQ